MTRSTLRRSPPPCALLAAAALLLLPACRDMDDLVPILGRSDYCASSRIETVACAIDGDTVDLNECDEDLGEQVRFLGVDAPEIEHPPEPAECWGDEAHAWVAARLPGRQVRLEFDQECEDTYGRTLAWLWIEGDSDDPIWDELVDLELEGLDVEEGTFEVLFNEYIVRAGQAGRYEESFAEAVRYFERLGVAEELAAQEGLGLWDACTE